MYLCMYVCMLFISYSCTNDDQKQEDSQIAKRHVAVPQGLISPERAKELDANWTTTRANALEVTKGQVDNRSVKFSLEDLRNYLDYAENQAQTLGYEMDGVRIYFAAYGSNEPNGKANQATVFLVPTGREVISQASMFFMMAEDGSGDIPGGDGLNLGGGGDPPSASYPQ